MSDLVPAPAGQLRPGQIDTEPPGPGRSFADPAGGSPLMRLRDMTSQPALRRAIPWFVGAAALGGTALMWALLSPAPQRTLYSQLGDADKAAVVASLDKAGIAYQLDNGTGAVTVGEDDLYRARMLVASDGAVAAPPSGDELLNNLPMGASRTMEAERLRAARERELQLTVMEIDGVEAVRVHLAEAEKSVFVRDNLPPSASVMVKLAPGRQLAQSQVQAIRSLVAGSVPGLAIDAVKVVDQAGRLLSEGANGDGDRFDLQSRMEDKLRRQLAQLLTPMLGAGNFSSEIQVELDMDEVTSARESYDKEGVVRTETQAASQNSATAAAGVPGVLANTPPPATTAQPGAPQGNPPANAAPGTTGESSSSRTFELGREVQVANAAPGKIRRLTVAVALSAEAMKQAKAADIEQIKQLVGAAVGANPQRGDQVEVVVRSFQPEMVTEQNFWEAPWFATVLRHGVALLAVLLVLFLGVRPLIKAIKRPDAAGTADTKKRKGKAAATDEDDEESGSEDEADGEDANAEGATSASGMTATNRLLPRPADPGSEGFDTRRLGEQVSLAQRMTHENPDAAAAVVRQMLVEPSEKADA